MSSKPPLGLIPRPIYYQQALLTRYTQVTEAMQRYLDHKTLPIPQDWIDEYYILLQFINYKGNPDPQPPFPIDEVIQHNSLLKIL